MIIANARVCHDLRKAKGKSPIPFTAQLASYRGNSFPKPRAVPPCPPSVIEAYVTAGNANPLKRGWNSANPLTLLENTRTFILLKVG